MKNEETDYAAYVTLNMIGGKWSLLILCHLRKRTVRFCEFPKLIPGLTQKILTKHLRELENHGLVHRTVFPEIPPKVEYSLTEHGKSLGPVLDCLEQWGKDHLNRARSLNRCVDNSAEQI